MMQKYFDCRLRANLELYLETTTTNNKNNSTDKNINNND